MKVLVTGAAGVLGREVTGMLEGQADVTLRLTDRVALDTPHEFVRADLSETEATRPLSEGIDVLMHIASIHPWKPYTPRQYIDCNIKGTHNILQAAAEGSVERVILTSSIAAMGMSECPSCPLPWDESKPCTPSDMYSISKHVGEQFCGMYAGQGCFRYLALRPGTFVPRDVSDPGFGLGLLFQWLHVSDVARAHVLALGCSAENEAVVITSRVPFTHEDSTALLTDARSVILKYFPRAAELEQRGIELPRRIPLCYDIGKAERLLGYDPQYTFASWLGNALS